MSELPPRQNRVDPWGELHSVAARGSLMGNRGILHEGQRIVRRWANKAWVSCVLEETFQKRTPFSPNTYSELFFLDEATAFAAGHRPCRTCQRARHEAFNTAWSAANAAGGSATRLPIASIDQALHAERAKPDRTKRNYVATLADLPPGTFFEHEGQARLVSGIVPPVWSFNGYTAGGPVALESMVLVLTPASIVRLFRSGFRPSVHPSALAPLSH